MGGGGGNEGRRGGWGRGLKEGLDRFKDLWKGGEGGEGGGEGRGGEVRGGFKAVGWRGRGRDIRIKCKVKELLLGWRRRRRKRTQKEERRSKNGVKN